MHEEFILYQGRSVPKSSFRAHVYGQDGAKKLAETWIHYESLLATGLWFSTINEVPKKEELVVEDKVVVKYTNSEVVKNDTKTEESVIKDPQITAENIESVSEEPIAKETKSKGRLKDGE